jgi:hypothetical protein
MANFKGSRVFDVSAHGSRCRPGQLKALFTRVYASLDPNGWAGLLFILGVSVWFVLRTFGIDFLEGTSGYWQTDRDDITQHIAGLNMYLASEWHYPLLAFNSLNYPDGTRVTFVDAIPLLAFLLKILRVGGEGQALVNPFGYWLGLCFILQGFSAWWMVRELRYRSWSLLVFLFVVFFLNFALMARLGHIALMSHWVLLFAFCLYVRGYKNRAFPLFLWSSLLLIAFYVHIYLFVMAAGIYLASVTTIPACIRGKGIFSAVMPFFILTASFFIFLLPLPPGAMTGDGGFGIYSMNLLAPISGGHLINVNATVMSGQYEGLNYLGLGLIAGLCGALFVMDAGRRVKLWRGHWALILMMTGFFLYSLSDRIYFGEHLLATIHYPVFLQPITSILRCSGRFFWPVYYAIAVFSIAVLYSKLPPRFFVVIAIFLVLMQAMDLRPAYRQFRDRVRMAPPPQHMSYEGFDAAIGANTKNVYFYPKFRCAEHAHVNLLTFMKYAASRGLNLNTGYIARYNPDCDDMVAEIAGSNPDESAYLFITENYDDRVVERIASLGLKWDFNCQAVEWATLCHAKKGAAQ